MQLTPFFSAAKRHFSVADRFRQFSLNNHEQTQKKTRTRISPIRALSCNFVVKILLHRPEPPNAEAASARTRVSYSARPPHRQQPTRAVTQIVPVSRLFRNYAKRRDLVIPSIRDQRFYRRRSGHRPRCALEVDISEHDQLKFAAHFE